MRRIILVCCIFVFSSLLIDAQSTQSPYPVITPENAQWLIPVDRLNRGDFDPIGWMPGYQQAIYENQDGLWVGDLITTDDAYELASPDQHFPLAHSPLISRDAQHIIAQVSAFDVRDTLSLLDTRTINLIDLQTGELRGRIDDLPANRHLMALDNTGTRIVAEVGQILRIYDVDSGERQLTVSMPNDVSSVLFTSDSQYLIVNGCALDRYSAFNFYLAIVDANTGEILHYQVTERDTDEGAINCGHIIMNDDDTLLTVIGTNFNNSQFWEFNRDALSLPNVTARAISEGNQVAHEDISPGHYYRRVEFSDGEICSSNIGHNPIIDLHIDLIPDPISETTRSRVIDDGERLIYRDNPYIDINFERFSDSFIFESRLSVSEIGVLVREQTRSIIQAGSSYFTIHNLMNSSTAHIGLDKYNAYYPILSPNEQYLVYPSWNSRHEEFSVFDLETMTHIFEREGSSTLALSEDGRLLATQDTNAVQIWQFPEMIQLRIIDFRVTESGSASDWDMAFHPDSQHLVVMRDNSLSYWDMETYEMLATAPEVQSSGRGISTWFLTFSTDGNYLLSFSNRVSSYPSTVYIWETDALSGAVPVDNFQSVRVTSSEEDLVSVSITEQTLTMSLGEEQSEPIEVTLPILHPLVDNLPDEISPNGDLHFVSNSLLSTADDESLIDINYRYPQQIVRGYNLRFSHDQRLLHDNNEGQIVMWAVPEAHPNPSEVACYSPTTNLLAGTQAVVTATSGPRFLRVRNYPNGVIRDSIPSGTIVDVVRGPICVNNQLWWGIQTEDGNTFGWSAEAISEDDYLLQSLGR